MNPLYPQPGLDPKNLEVLRQALRLPRFFEERYSLTIPFETSGRYPQTTSSGTITFSTGASGGVVNFTTSTGTTNRAALSAPILSPAGDGIDYFDRNPSFSTVIQVPAVPGAGNTKSAYVVFGQLDPTFAALTGKHFGFEVRITDGVGSVYATWADGATRRDQVLSGVTATDVLLLHAALTSGNRIEFWVNDELKHKAQITLPSGNPGSGVANRLFVAGVNSSVGTTALELYLAPVSVSFTINAINA